MHLRYGQIPWCWITGGRTGFTIPQQRRKSDWDPFMSLENALIEIRGIVRHILLVLLSWWIAGLEDCSIGKTSITAFQALKLMK